MGECVICLQSDPPPEPSGCACRGDAGLVHAACLVECAVAQRASRGARAWTTCQTCTQEFSGAIGLALAKARCETEPGMDALASLGVALRRNGRYDDAERVQRAVLAERRATLGDEHPQTVESMNNLGAALTDNGKHAEAETVLREALRVRDDPGTRSNLATSLSRRGNYAAAERLYRSIVRERELASGSDTVETLHAKCNLGVMLAAQSKLDEAETLFREVAARRRRVLGDEHPETLVCLGNLASLCLAPHGGGSPRAAERFAEAEEIQRGVLSLQRRTIGEEHPHTLTTEHNLARSIWGQGRHDEARELAGVVLAARVRAQGKSHPDTVESARLLREFSARGSMRAANATCRSCASCTKPLHCGISVACARCGLSIYCSRACRIADARAHKRTCMKQP